MRERVVVGLVRGIGVLSMLVGVGALAIAPLEMVCFSWFSEGGRFGYAGFGYGSFMFGNLAMQILGYHAIAAVTIPLGLGHLKLRRWIRPVMLALLRVWWVVGVPILLGFLFILFASKELTMVVAVIAMVLAALSYGALPWVLKGFYDGTCVRQVLTRDEADESWAEALGESALTVVGLEIGGLIVLQVLLFFGGLFPLGWRWATGLSAFALVDVCVFALLMLLWGTVNRQRWAWWGALAFVGAMAVLWSVTLAHTSWVELLAVMAFPPAEVAFLDGIPLQGWHLALLVGVPLVGATVTILRTGEAFDA